MPDTNPTERALLDLSFRLFLIETKLDLLIEMHAVTIAEAKEMDWNDVYSEWLELLMRRQSDHPQ